jgi:hypothetical protein
MLGGFIMAFVLVVVIPVGVMMAGAVLSAVLGWSLKNEGEETNKGSELLALNK